MKTLLVVDDEESVRMSLQSVFAGKYHVVEAADGKEALQVVEDEAPDVAILDLMMPGMSGLELLPQLKQADPRLVVIVLSAMNEVAQIVQAVRLGAVRYLTKPFDIHEVRLTVQLALREAGKDAELSALESEITRWYDVDKVVGESEAWTQTLSMVRRAAEAADTTVMFYGESGTGKELLARLTHDLSARREAPMLPIHCAAIPEALLESELFGHEKGSFTGATERRRGCVEMADGGTLFLDEIGEMPSVMQSKMLRFLQDHQFMRVGGRHSQQADVRVVGATNRNLKQGVSEGWFREDLYYRLNVVPIQIPALRERQGDVPLLVRHFVKRFSAECSARMGKVSTAAMECMERYSWPGNIRELGNTVERVLVLHGDEDEFKLEHLPSEIRAGTAPGAAPQAAQDLPLSLDAEVEQLERRLLGAALQEAGGNLSQAAVLLQTTRRIVAYKVEQYGIGGSSAQTRKSETGKRRVKSST